MFEHWWVADVHDKKKDWVQTMYKTDPKQNINLLNYDNTRKN